MTVPRGQMAATSITGPTQGIPSVSGRAAKAAPVMPRPSKVYWQSNPPGLIRTPAVSALPAVVAGIGSSPDASASGTPSTTTNGGSCCG